MQQFINRAKWNANVGNLVFSLLLLSPWSSASQLSCQKPSNIFNYFPSRSPPSNNTARRLFRVQFSGCIVLLLAIKCASVKKCNNSSFFSIYFCCVWRMHSHPEPHDAAELLRARLVGDLWGFGREPSVMRYDSFICAWWTFTSLARKKWPKAGWVTAEKAIGCRIFFSFRAGAQHFSPISSSGRLGTRLISAHDSEKLSQSIFIQF